jgi:hypothetical protein
MVDSDSNIWMINCFDNVNLLEIKINNESNANSVRTVKMKFDIVRLHFSKYMDLYITSLDHLEQMYNIDKVDLDQFREGASTSRKFKVTRVTSFKPSTINNKSIIDFEMRCSDRKKSKNSNMSEYIIIMTQEKLFVSEVDQDELEEIKEWKIERTHQ